MICVGCNREFSNVHCKTCKKNMKKCSDCILSYLYRRLEAFSSFKMVHEIQKYNHLIDKYILSEKDICWNCID